MISVRIDGGEESIPLDEFESRVRQGLIHPSTSVCFPVLTGDRWVEARDLELFRRLYAPAQIHFSRFFSLSRFPFMTAGLVLLQVIIYFAIAGAQRVLPLDVLIAAGAKTPPNILELGETWRLITANLLHRDILHLIFNMFFLFNVGGTIENAYRLQDYLLIIVASALATTIVSTLMSTTPSVGASGMVLGLFGSASIFGYKYSDILPKRYRRYFGGAVLPYALFILYVGLTTDDTDNWGHLGGLIGGLVITIPLVPCLLRIGQPDRSWVLSNLSGFAALGLLGVTLVAGPLLMDSGPRLEEAEDERSGIRFVYPSRWARGKNHLGYEASGNKLGASIGIRAERHAPSPIRLLDIRKRFLEEELSKREEEGDITSVSLVGERPFLLDGAKGRELIITLESRAGPQVTRNILIVRGYYSYIVVLSSPKAWANKYEPIFDLMAKGIQLVDTTALNKDRRMVSVFPGMSSAHVKLAGSLSEIGRVEEAAQSYQRALESFPDHADALYGLAKLATDFGGDLLSAERIASDLHERNPSDRSYTVLLAELKKRLGQTDRACVVLQEALDRQREPDEELRARLRDLRCRSEPWLER